MIDLEKSHMPPMTPEAKERLKITLEKIFLEMYEEEMAALASGQKAG